MVTLRLACRRPTFSGTVTLPNALLATFANALLVYLEPDCLENFVRPEKESRGFGVCGAETETLFHCSIV
jgi:hypothetical protein